MNPVIRSIDQRLVPLLRRWSIPLLRYALAIVFIWFGALKVFDVTPVADLVRSTIYWIDGSWVVPAIGLVEVLVGIGLLLGRQIRLVLLLLILQMAGTFLVFLILPETTFDSNIFELTVEGEFILKNLVLITAALVVGSAIRLEDEPEGATADQVE